MAKKEEKKDKKEKEETTAQYIKLSSLGDLARNSSAFGGSVRPLFAVKSGAVFRLMSNGPRMDGSRLVFYVDAKKAGNFLCYKPETTLDKAQLEINGTVSMEGMKRDTIIVPIIELLSGPFKESKKTKEDIKCIQVRDHASIIKGTIIKSMQDEHIGKVYAFTYKSKRYIGSFSLVEDEGSEIFCFAQAEGKECSFFKYNYNTDKVDPTDVFGEHQHMYVRVINLAEPFSFFKV